MHSFVEKCSLCESPFHTMCAWLSGYNFGLATNTDLTSAESDQMNCFYKYAYQCKTVITCNDCVDKNFKEEDLERIR